MPGKGKYRRRLFFTGKMALLILLVLVVAELAGKYVTLMPLRIVMTLACLAAFTAITLAIYRHQPVKRDRLLFARSGWGMALYSLAAIVLVLSCIYAVAAVWDMGAGMVYDSQNGTVESEHHSLVWNIISQFADPGNLPQAKDEGTAISLVSALAGILCLSGLVVSSLVSMIARRTQRWRKGLIRYQQGFDNYVAIIGYNEQTASIIKQTLKQSPDSYVLLQTRKDVEQERAKLELKLGREDEERVVFYYGERTLFEDIKDLRLECATEVYVLGEDMEYENEKDHDSFNMKCLELISNYCEHLRNDTPRHWSGKKLKCHVELEYQSTYTIFKSTHIYKQLNEHVEFIPFNVHEIWAKKVLVDLYAVVPGSMPDEYKVQRYLPLDCYKDEQNGGYKTIGIDEEKAVHLFVVGMNQMGVALAMQTALLMHLPNYHTKGMRTTITLIDNDAVKEGEFLKGRFAALFSLCRHRTIVVGPGQKIGNFEQVPDQEAAPMACEDAPYHHLGDNFMDLQWEFIQGNLASEELQSYMIQTTADTKKTVSVAVCLNDPQQAVATALYLPEMVLKRVLQVLVYQKNNFDLIKKVSEGEREWKRYEKLRPFGMTEESYHGNMFDNVMAKLTLTLYKDKYLQYKNVDLFIDYINRHWAAEGIVNKLSNINLVDSFNLKLRSANLSLDASRNEINRIFNNNTTVNILAMAEHSRWLTERLTMGYRPLSKDELDDICSQPDAKAKKARKEYYKAKYRAHLDICSYSQLQSIDNGVLENDRRIIRNLLKLKIHHIKNELICRMALRPGDWLESENQLCSAWRRVWRLRGGSQRRQQPENPQQEKLGQLLRDMVKVKEGKLKRYVTFTRDEEQQANTVLKPVKMSPMWVGRCPVTQRLWKEVMGQSNNRSEHIDENCPVENVSKEQIDDFLAILNDRTGLHFRLPTKEEWLFAALGGYTPDEFRRHCDIKSMAWCQDGARETDVNGSQTRTHRVGGDGVKQPNAFGIYDMLGNVWEWTQTPHGVNTFYICGGSYRFGLAECNLADKNETWCCEWTADFKSSDIGFRLMLPHAFDIDTSERSEPLEEQKRLFHEIVIKGMTSVSEGSFLMGTNSVRLPGGDSTRPDERPAVRVAMSHFMMGTEPVTQRQYVAFMQNNPSEFKGDDRPVENVSYHDVVDFVNRLNDYALERDLLPGVVRLFELPTAAQWEYAAKGGNQADEEDTIHFLYSGGDNPDVVAWHHGITKCTHPVKMKEPNRLGLYDMSGNVWEWCRDYYQADFLEKLAAQTHVQDPDGPATGFSRQLRGGSWKYPAHDCRVTRVNSWTEDYKASDVGFRLVMNITKEQYDALTKQISAS